nr:squalene/phytoene synthase family protein [Hasllibacter sp. MH4015]
MVARGDPRRFRAAMAGPLKAREVLLPLYAFNIEVSRAPWLTEEPMIAEMRLQWWRDALEEVSDGRGRRHEVVDALGFLDRESAGLLDQLVAARRWDIYKDPFEDAGHFTDYLTQTSAHLMEAGLRALGGTPDAGTRAIGFGAGLARFLLAIPDLEARGRVPLVDGRAETVAGLAQTALGNWPGRVDQPMPARAALFEAAGAKAILQRAARTPGLVAQGGLDASPISERLSLMGAAFLGRI